jgi:hypothetical protein
VRPPRDDVVQLGSQRGFQQRHVERYSISLHGDLTGRDCAPASPFSRRQRRARVTHTSSTGHPDRTPRGPQPTPPGQRDSGAKSLCRMDSCCPKARGRRVPAALRALLDPTASVCRRRSNAAGPGWRSAKSSARDFGNWAFLALWRYVVNQFLQIVDAVDGRAQGGRQPPCAAGTTLHGAATAAPPPWPSCSVTRRSMCLSTRS